MHRGTQQLTPARARGTQVSAELERQAWRAEARFVRPPHLTALPPWWAAQPGHTPCSALPGSAAGLWTQQSKAFRRPIATQHGPRLYAFGQCTAADTCLEAVWCLRRELQLGVRGHLPQHLCGLQPIPGTPAHDRTTHEGRIRTSLRGRSVLSIIACLMTTQPHEQDKLPPRMRLRFGSAPHRCAHAQARHPGTGRGGGGGWGGRGAAHCTCPRKFPR